MPKPIHLNLSAVYVENEDGDLLQLLDMASDKLAELVKSVIDTGKAGSLTLKLDLKPSTAGALAVKGEVKLRKPAKLPREALLWATPDGNLMAEDPKQIKLDLKPVQIEKTELKSVSA